MTTVTCEDKWCQKMMCQQHHSQQNMIKNWLWMSKKTEWESSVQSWNKNDSWHQKYDNLYWTVCYEKNCTTHESEKQKEYYSQALKKYCKKKETRWAT